jgi:hypothetical protein
MSVMAGLVPATHTHRFLRVGAAYAKPDLAKSLAMDGRDKPGHDDPRLVIESST